MLLAGSAGEGIADAESNIDLIAFYDVMPASAAVRAWRAEVGVGETRAGRLRKSGWLDMWPIDGAECQSGGILIAHVEKNSR